MANPNVNKEAPESKPSISEAVEGLIQKKKAEQSSEGSTEVQSSVENTQGEVAEVMAGVNKPKEKISERAGESGEKGDIQSSATQAQDEQEAQKIAAQFTGYTMPRETIMVKKIRTAINRQIKQEIKKARKLEKNLTQGGAQEYNAVIARIRMLKDRLASLVTATTTFIKNMYVQYFKPDGKRKSMDEL